MCGINGIISPISQKDQNDSAISNLVTKMNEALIHRGPDGSGVQVMHANSCNIALGQNRLSIIDLSMAGQQPIRYHREIGAFSHLHNSHLLEKYAETGLCMAFNGEIYNYQEIKDELINKGYLFTSKTDTEVVLAAYLEYGDACVEKFNGMRAFVLFDPSQQKILCSRDRLGKKPFYYAFINWSFIFSSEVKGILSTNLLPPRSVDHIDREALDLYLNAGYIPAPWSIYSDIKKLPARSNMVLSMSDKFSKPQITTYDELPVYKPEYDLSKLIKEWKELLADAVKIRMFTADVPVGAFLSWWLDSSSVVAEMTQFVEKDKLHTFSIGFESPYDESEYIEIVKNAFGTNHHHSYFTQPDFDSLLDELTFTFDEPLGDPSIFPTYQVSKMAKEQITVSLSWDGGDEVFGGYPIYKVAYLLSFLRKFPRILRRISYWIFKIFVKPTAMPSMLEAATEALRLTLQPQENFYGELFWGTLYKSKTYQDWTSKILKNLLDKNSWSFTQTILDFDLFHNTLADNYLSKVDRASMAHALEVRSPFLDRRFIQFAHKIPVCWKVSLWNTKILMRKIISGLVPSTIISRKKHGFTPPIETWILQEKYQTQLNNGLDELMSKWALTDEWKEFYSNKVMKNNGRLYSPFKIRMFFLISRYYRRINQSN